MTSSLVGSEMCIRDRSCPVITCPVSGLLLSLVPIVIRRSALDLLPGILLCLLYTSDAADDM
eukprot:7109069-Prorocentrum_lima.AAC.1